MRRRLSPLIALGLGAALLVAPAASPPAAVAAPAGMIIDSPVTQVLDAAIGPDGTTYAVGSFSQVGAATGGLARLDTTSGTVDRSFPAVNGSVNAMVQAPDGSIYLGGNFISVGGLERHGLARLNPDGTVDATWAPQVSGNPSFVNSLAIDETTIVIGGYFSAINGQARQHLGAVDTVAGELLSWAPDPNFSVDVVATDDTHIYVSGSFTTIASTSRNLLAAFMSADLSLDSSWNPAPTNAVTAITPSEGLVYVGGQFTTIAATPRNRLAALDATTGAATSWDPNLNGSVAAIVVDDTLVYAGGNYTQVNSGVSLNRLGAFRTDDTGTATTWSPDVNGNVQSILLDGTDVYVGGAFQFVGGIRQQGLARVDGFTAVPDLTWSPRLPNGGSTSVRSMIVDGSDIVAGGGYTHVNTVTRNGAAAFDTQMRVTSWDPDLSNSTVYGIGLSGSTAYLVGDFGTVNGSVTRNYAAAFRTDDTGTVTAWDPDPGDYPYDMAISGNIAYLVGDFGDVAGTTRNYAAAVRIDDAGTLTSWDPDLDSTVYSIALDGITAYMAGDFTTVNGSVTRNYAVGVRTDDTGTVTAWDADIGNNTNVVAVADGRVYVGGGFNTVNGSVPRDYAASFDNVLGNVTEWNPEPDSDIYELQVAGGHAYLAGGFHAINGGSADRDGLAAVSVDDTGTVVANWVPVAFGGFDPGGSYDGRLRVAGDRLLVMGSFPMATLNGVDYAGGLAALPLISSPSPQPPTPAPSIPASAPVNVLALPDNRAAQVSWSPPAQSGSFAITNYRVVAQPGSHSCLTTGLTCTLTGLSNERQYSLTVAALSGAGWGSASTPVTVTPKAQPVASIAITGSRDGRVIRVSGLATGLDNEAVLAPWIRLSGQSGYAQGSARVTPDATGAFTWQRKTGKKAHVYVMAMDGVTRSNTVTISAR